MSADTYDVVIIGAGLSGLVTASELDKAGFKTVVLEATNEVGGRTRTRTFEGNIYHLGGEFVGRNQPQYIKLIKSLGLTLTESPANFRKARWHANGKTFVGYFPEMSYRETWISLKLFTKLSIMAFRVPPSEPWLAPRAKELDVIPYEEWMRKEGMTDNLRHYIAAVVEGELSVPMEQLSLLFMLWLISVSGNPRAPRNILGLIWWYMSRIGAVIKAALRRRWISGPGSPLELELNALNMWVSGGTQEVSKRLTKNLQRGKVLFNTPITKISQHDMGVTAKSETGQEFIAKYAVVAIPWPQLKKLEFDPPCNEAIRSMIDELDYGKMSRVNLVKAGAPLGKPSFAFGWEHACAGWNRNNLVVSLVPCDSSNLPADVLIEAAAATFDVDAGSRINPIVYNWNKAPYQGGSFMFFRPGQLTRHGPTLSQSHGLVHFAGSERGSWPNFMAGAVESGYKASEKLIPLLRGR